MSGTKVLYQLFRWSVLPAPAEKPVYVRRMFDTIAARYDRVNRLMTFGLDRGWRRSAVEEVATSTLQDVKPSMILDVGTGTGDFLPIIRRVMPDAAVVGVDFSLPMMQAGREKADANAAYVGGDALRLPFPDNTFDGATTGFAMRNVADLPAALAEIRRVVRPGGRLACLEVARPAHWLIRAGHQLYFNRLVPLLGGLISGNRKAYTYLPQSAAHFPPPDELCRQLEQAGWYAPRYRLLGLGAVAVHTAEK